MYIANHISFNTLHLIIEPIYIPCIYIYIMCIYEYCITNWSELSLPFYLQHKEFTQDKFYEHMDCSNSYHF